MDCKTLHDIEQYLEKKGIPSKIQDKSDAVPFEQLFVPIGVDYDERQMALQFRIIENPSDDEERKENHYLLHTFFAFPFKVDKATVSDTARLTNLLNKVLIIPGLMYSEADEVVAFHHVNSGTLSGIHTDVIEFMIMNVIYLVDVFMKTIKDVTLKEKTFEQVVEEAKKQASEEKDA